MEPGIITLAIVVVAVLSILVGVQIGRYRSNNSETHGVIYADIGGPESSPSLFLEAKVPIEDIASKKKVSFDVVVISNDSRK